LRRISVRPYGTEGLLFNADPGLRCACPTTPSTQRPCVGDPGLGYFRFLPPGEWTLPVSFPVGWQGRWMTVTKILSLSAAFFSYGGWAPQFSPFGSGKPPGLDRKPVHPTPARSRESCVPAAPAASNLQETEQPKGKSARPSRAAELQGLLRALIFALAKPGRTVVIY
jgi:hypothetical protein